MGANTDSRGFFMMSRSGTTFQTSYKNGSLISNRNISVGFGNTNIYIGALNLNGTASNYASRQLCFASIGLTLDSKQSQFASIVNTYQTSLGRNTY